jgi:hypothetical protein
MPAIDRYQLLVESQTRGEAEVRRFSDALNKLADTVDRNNKKTASSAEASGKRVSQATAAVRKDVELTGASIQRSLTNPLEALSDKIVGGSSGLAKFAGAAAGITAAVALTGAGLKTFLQGVSETALEIRSLSQSTGLTISQADKLRAAANLTGFDIRNLKEAALDLSVALKDSGGQGGQTRDLLRQLGVQAVTAAGDARPLGDVLLETFEALSKIDDVTKRVNLSRVLGGEDAAKNVQPLLVGLREANRVAEQLGFGTRDNLLKALDESYRQLLKFDAQWEILKGKLAEKIAPIVIPFITRVVDTVSGDFRQGLFFPGTQRAADYGQAFRQTAAAAQTGVDGAGILDGERVDVRGSLGRLAPAVPSAISDFSSATAMAARFRAGLSGNDDGIKLRIDEIGKQRAELVQKLSSGALAPATFKELEGKLANLAAEEFRLHGRIKQIEAARAGAELRIDSSTLVPLNTGSTVSVQRFPSLLRRGENPDAIASGARSFFVADSAAIAAANQDTGQFAARAQGEAAAAAASRERAVQFVQQELQFQLAKIELLSGPGGELATVERIAALKRAALEQELQSGAEIVDLRERQLAIEEERVLRLLELQRRRRDEARGLASDLVGSLQAGRPGDFFRNQRDRLINQVGTNALEGVTNRALGALGQFGASTGLGGLLRGTILDPANATPVDRNTAATDRNTAALERMTTGGAIGGLTGGGGVGGVLSGALSGLGIPGGVFQGTSRNPTIFSAAPGGGMTPVPGFIGLGQDDTGQVAPFSGPPAISKGLRGVGIAGAAAGGVLGVLSGIRQGGARGAIDATGSAAGAASTILALSGVTGPAAPILAGVALGAMFLKGALPDPKQERDRRLNALISDSIFTEAAPTTYTMDARGRAFDQNKRGDYRSIPPIQVTINALDSRSFLDNRESIADAVRLAAYEGHGIGRAMREVVLAR